jgi:hypothetical protein
MSLRPRVAKIDAVPAMMSARSATAENVRPRGHAHHDQHGFVMRTGS